MPNGWTFKITVSNKLYIIRNVVFFIFFNKAFKKQTAVFRNFPVDDTRWCRKRETGLTFELRLTGLGLTSVYGRHIKHNHTVYLLFYFSIFQTEQQDDKRPVSPSVRLSAVVQLQLLLLYTRARYTAVLHIASFKTIQFDCAAFVRPEAMAIVRIFFNKIHRGNNTVIVSVPLSPIEIFGQLVPISSSRTRSFFVRLIYACKKNRTSTWLRTPLNGIYDETITVV